MARKKWGPGYIYLIHAIDTPYYKIGHAVDVARRLWQVNNTSPHMCVLVHAIPVDRQTQGESFWHQLFAPSRVKGEWFALTEKQVVLFCACDGGSVVALDHQVYRDNQALFMEVMDSYNDTTHD